MAVKVAINGFGRIGRLVARAILARPTAGSNWWRSTTSPTPSRTRFCSSVIRARPYAGTVEVDGNDLIIDGKRVKVSAERDPANLPHAANGVDIALECTGFFTDRASAEKHLAAGPEATC